MTMAENNTLKSTRTHIVRSANDDVAIRDKITKLKDEVKTLGASLAETGGEETQRILEKGEEMSHDAVAKSREALDDVSFELDTLEARLIKHVREKPMQSLGFALAAGAVLAVLQRK